MRRISFLFLLIFLVFHCDSAVYGRQVVVPETDGKPAYKIGKSILFLEDAERKFSLPDVLESDEHFQLSEKETLNFGYVNSRFWLKTELINRSDHQDFVLEIDNPVLDSLKVWFILPDGRSEMAEAGDLYPFDARKIKSRTYVFRIPFRKIEKGETIRLVILCRSAGAVRIPLRLMRDSHFFESQKAFDLLAVGYLGFFLALIFYNLFLFFSLRDSAYFYYVLFIGFFIMLQFSLLGYASRYLWPEKYFFTNVSSIFFAGLTVLSALIFTYKFLKLRDLFGKKWMFWFYSLYFSAGSVFLSAALAIFIPEVSYFAMVITPPLSLYAVLGMIVTGVYAALKKYRPARYYLLAWMFILFGTIIQTLKNTGFLPTNFFIDHVLMISSLAEILMLAFALADRIKEARRATLSALKKNRELIADQNRVLEQKVQSRTKDLAARTEELQLSKNEISGKAKILEKVIKNLNQTREHLRTALQNQETKNEKLEQVNLSLKEAQSALVQSEKMASLGQLTAGIAHEINNPINFVLGGAQVLDDLWFELTELLVVYDQLCSAYERKEAVGPLLAQLTELKKEMNYEDFKKDIELLIRDIGEGARRTAEIVVNLRQFSRLDENALKFIDIRTGIDSALVILRSQYKDRIEIVKDYADNLPEIECYPGLLNQVLMNILTNSLQAIKGPGRIKICIRTLQEKGKDFLLVEISDSGPGVPEEVQDKIFDPFFTTKEVGEGTGLGLSVSYGIVIKHGGHIRVRNQENSGAVFSLILPLVHPGESASI